ncbi:DUF5946 family protein [Nonomuraea longicatena]|uniref:Uncharacterized protein n=1 Tax=Nonomuraea longicatena TaxID=83682 RepID=A0ABN1PM94_9ACTN
METCPECGAPACENLFQLLLALDHSRQPPWGPLHGVSVACYLWQHPSRLPASGGAAAWAILHAFLRDGSGGATRQIRQVRRTNSHRSGSQKPSVASDVVAPTPDRRPEHFTVTIADVAENGEFPAEGFTERVTAWAAATVAAWRV